MKATYLLNAFSLQMVDVPCNVHCEEVDVLPDGLTSAVGHVDTAHVLGVEPNGRTQLKCFSWYIRLFRLTRLKSLDSAESEMYYKSITFTWVVHQLITA